MARRNRFSARGSLSSRSQPHRPSWSTGPNGIVTISSSSSVLYATGAQSQVDEVTIVRTRGLVTVFLSAGGTLEGFDGAIGICVVSENAFNVGITAVPTPVNLN